jgi:predicted HTH transcriptional regulator
VLRLLEDWETTNTDFKRELHLDSTDDKAEFARDVLALANTQVTGDRYLITGFDPKTHDFTTTADAKVTQDRIEDVLNGSTIPPATVKYTTFTWTDGTGQVGLVEVRRDRTKVPYRVKKGLTGASKSIRVGQVFVRHNSHVAEASPEEIADLEAEAKRARVDE